MCAPQRRRGFLGRPALRGPGRTSFGAYWPPSRLRFFASLESGCPGVVLAQRWLIYNDVTVYERLRLEWDMAKLGIATANLLSAAEFRLSHAGLWRHVSAHAAGAEGGGHKREILARAIASTGLPKPQIIYVGDNLNDVDAGLSNGVHFIGFSTSQPRLGELARAGNFHTSSNHTKTCDLICHLLDIDKRPKL